MLVTGLFATIIFIIVPGLIGSLSALFTTAGNDASVKSRTDSYDLAEWFINQSPILGRAGTFMPKYRDILDNQYLMLLIETGLVGVLVFVGPLRGDYRLCPARPRARQGTTRSPSSPVAVGQCGGLLDRICGLRRIFVPAVRRSYFPLYRVDGGALAGTIHVVVT